MGELEPVVGLGLVSVCFCVCFLNGTGLFVIRLIIFRSTPKSRPNNLYMELRCPSAKSFCNKTCVSGKN